MEDICNFIPPKKYDNSICYYHFVHETNIKKHRQPFFHSNYYAILVFKGSADLVKGNTTTPIKRGTLFFIYPYHSYTIKNYKDFSYMYISFNGIGAEPLLTNFNITNEHFIFENFDNVIEFWISSIRRVNATNANTLTESVLMYTLSFINSANSPASKEHKDKFASILDYVNYNYALQDMSIKKVAEIFFYNEKYISSLFIKKTGVKFTDYISKLRIEYASKLIKNGDVNITDISYKCGFSDPLYFSKVFKKNTGKSPTEYIKNNDTK